MTVMVVVMELVMMKIPGSDLNIRSTVSDRAVNLNAFNGRSDSEVFQGNLRR